MHLAWINRDNIAGLSFNHAPTARRLLRTAQDNANPELVMGMSAKRMGRVGRNRSNAFHSTTGYLEFSWYHQADY
ncbi:hypothetical protein SAMN03159496_05836 [Rhizobium sp. NFR07]|nr:hypothetical protein SAMN03159496_05836 [Rhizobium sp. NFR07]